MSDLNSEVGLTPLRRMLLLHRLVRVAARANLPVLIVGETGTGKELVAQAVHRLSSASAGPFVDVNCAAIAETLAEGELFGWERGAFTGAVGQRAGPLEEANGGTLFLDEACSLPPLLQAKLLRAIELQEFRRVGGSQRLRTRFRLITAIAQPEAALLGSGKWREDFACRIGGLTIALPALRTRGDDIDTLATAFLKAAASVGDSPKRLGEGAAGLLRRYSWPGNVRELKLLMGRLGVLTEGPTVLAEHVIAHLPRLALELDERTRLETVLSAFEWEVTKAARALGMSRANLYLRLRKHGLERATA